MCTLALPCDIKLRVLDFTLGTRKHWRSRYTACVAQARRLCSVRFCSGPWPCTTHGFNRYWYTVHHYGLRQSKPHCVCYTVNGS